MSGSEATGAEPGATTTAPDAGAGAPSQLPASAPAPSDPFDDLPADQAVFDRGYVEKIRKQGQRYHDEARTFREQLNSYDDVFGVYEPEDRDVWFSLAKQWANDPASAAQIMQQIANAVLGEGTESAPAAPSEPTGSPGGATGDEPMTAERIAELVQQQLAQADYERRQADMVESIYSTMRTAGVEPKSADGMAVLWLANNETEGDIDKALEQFKSTRQRTIDEYVSGRSGKPLPAPANGIPANASAEPIKNLDDARKAAEAFIRSQADAR